MGSTKYPIIPPPGGGTPSLPGQGQPKPLQPGEYGPTSNPSVTTFNYKGIAPPGGLYVTRNDSLQVLIENSATLTSVDLHARLLLASPTSILPGQPDHPPDPTQSSVPSNAIASITQNFKVGTNRASNVFFVPLNEGWLLNLTIGVTGVSKRGQTYAVVFLQRGDAVGGPQSGALLSGYVAGTANLIWPSTGTVLSVEGPGWMNSINQSNPAAGAEFVITVPALARWRLRCLNAQLVIANSGIARTNMLQIKDASGNTLYVASAPQNSAINTTVQVSGAPGGNITQQFSTIITIPLPGDLTLPAGFTIGSLTQQIGAGDQYSNIWALVEEWIEL